MKTRKIGITKQMCILISVLILLGDIILGAVLTNKVQSMLLGNIQQNARNISNCAASDVNPEQVKDNRSIGTAYIRNSLFIWKMVKWNMFTLQEW